MVSASHNRVIIKCWKPKLLIPEEMVRFGTCCRRKKIQNEQKRKKSWLVGLIVVKNNPTQTRFKEIVSFLSWLKSAAKEDHRRESQLRLCAQKTRVGFDFAGVCFDFGEIENKTTWGAKTWEREREIKEQKNKNIREKDKWTRKGNRV